ncbi:restriction endonuclease [Roseibium sp.]|uniref:restriction endonuclease n=1 Tax=Roseibium sp. TaxID=1936156 RepID=UPI003B503D98
MDREINDILSPLLRAEGYQITVEDPVSDTGVDLKGERAGNETIVVESKICSKGRPVGQNVIRQFLAAASDEDASRAIVVSNTGFTPDAEDLVRHQAPLNIQLLNFDGIRNWAEQLHAPDSDVEREVVQTLRETSRQLAKLVARDARALVSMEWRDMERLMAEVFEGLGFSAELTPPSKDGGKDVIVTCEVKGRRATYFLEVKHWRSATRVGSNAVQELLNVVVAEKVAGGLFLSTYGFTSNAFEQLTVLDRKRIRFEDQEKIVSLCQTYVKAKSGVWSPPEDLSDLLMA